MPLDIAKALRSPGESIPFIHEESIPPQEVLGDTVTFEPLRMEGSVTVRDNRLRLQGELRSVAHARCANCLEPASYPLLVSFDEIFTAQSDYHQEEDPLEDAERLVFDGPKLKVDQLALTLALLELPLRFLCREDCAGLDNVTPLHDTHAGQKEMPDEHPFSALQELLNKDQEV